MEEIMMCEQCGHEQPDMGQGVVCEACGGNLVPKENGTNGASGTDAPQLPADKKPCRELTTHKCGAGMDEAIQILVLDEPGPGNACHHYMLALPNWKRNPDGSGAEGVIDIHFQKGAVAEAGPNGISCESLLAVIIDRLEGFQSGSYPCEENAIALDHCQRAIRTLHKRTIERAARRVEGGEKA